MTIQQKISYLHYLLIGISAFVFITGCGKEDEYNMTMDLLFNNQTDNEISFDIRPSISSSNMETIIILPKTQSNILSYNVEGVEKKLNPDNCCQDVLIDVYGDRGIDGESQILKINNSFCVTHLNEKSVALSNYTIEKIADRHFRYTYTFTNNDFENPEPCE